MAPDRLCKWCGKPLDGPGITNHATTHPGECREKHRRRTECLARKRAKGLAPPRKCEVCGGNLPIGSKVFECESCKNFKGNLPPDPPRSCLRCGEETTEGYYCKKCRPIIRAIKRDHTEEACFFWGRQEGI